MSLMKILGLGPAPATMGGSSGSDRASALRPSPSAPNLKSSTSWSLAVDVDCAEKGLSDHHNHNASALQRLIHPGSIPWPNGHVDPASSQLTNTSARGNKGEDEAATTGADRYVEADIAIEGKVEMVSVQDRQYRKRSFRDVEALSRTTTTDALDDSIGKTGTRMTEQTTLVTQEEPEPPDKNGYSRILTHDCTLQIQVHLRLVNKRIAQVVASSHVLLLSFKLILFPIF